MAAKRRAISEERARAWWRGAIVDLQAELKQFARSHLRGRSADQEDVVGDTVAAVAGLLERNERAFPSSWQKPEQPSPVDQEHFRRLVFRIASRRVADRFRLDEKLLRKSGADGTGEPEEAALDASNTEIARVVAMRELLTETVVALSELRPDDRDLLIIVAEGLASASALSDRDRQRLRRARARLVSAIRQRLGESAGDILREEE